MSEKPLSFMEKLLSLVPLEKKQETKEYVAPFIPRLEYVCPNTGIFYTIGLVQVIHVREAARFNGMDMMIRLIQLCVRADGVEMSDKDLLEMEFRTYKNLAERISSLM